MTFVRPSVGLSHMNYVEYLSAVKWNYTISSTSDQAMLHVVQCVCKKSISNYRKHTEEYFGIRNYPIQGQ